MSPQATSCLYSLISFFPISVQHFFFPFFCFDTSTVLTGHCRQKASSLQPRKKWILKLSTCTLPWLMSLLADIFFSWIGRFPLVPVVKPLINHHHRRSLFDIRGHTWPFGLYFFSPLVFQHLPPPSTLNSLFCFFFWWRRWHFECLLTTL